MKGPYVEGGLWKRIARHRPYEVGNKIMGRDLQLRKRKINTEGAREMRDNYTKVVG